CRPASGSEAIGADARADRRSRHRRILQGPHRARRGGGQRGRGRYPVHAGFRRLHRTVGKADSVQLPRLHHSLRASAQLGRYDALRDPAFVHNPIDELLSPAHAAKLRSTILPDEATPSAAITGALGATEGNHTTHYSVADGYGNAVSVTYTLNFLFGIRQIAGSTGFFLNDEMDDFTSKPGVANAAGLVQGRVNQVEPGKRPLSSMTPTILMRDGKPVLLTGSPGDATIISTTLQSILNIVDYGM